MSIVLDDAQRRVVQAPPKARVFVEAGAGSGKTEVVAARLEWLSVEEGLSPSTEILVLSFSRAAVHAVRMRVDEGDGAGVNVRTFDSFASQVLLELEIEPQGSFDHRIRQATQALQSSADVPAAIEDLAHVVIDEVQDLVGDRAEFVLAVLANLGKSAGLTVLGDPLQGIYDFVLEASDSQLSFDQFLDVLMTKHELERVLLGGNYRARGEECRALNTVAEGVRAAKDPLAALALIGQFEESLTSLDRPDDWGFAESLPGRVAILCRSNAEVLSISRSLGDQDIPHVVRREARAFGAARWIAPALGGLSGPVVPQSDVEVALAETLDESGVEGAWYLLKAAERNSRNRMQIDLGRLRAVVRSDALPLSLTQGDESDLIVSTVHRAKGLEFDSVVVVASDRRFADEASWAEVRRRYVALSRARDRIVTVRARTSASSIREFDWLSGRLQERVGKSGHTRARAMEIGSRDIRRDRPTGAGGREPRSIQRVLEVLEPGRSVIGSLDADQSDRERPVYTMTVDGFPIASTTDEFGAAFARLFKVRPGLWPAELTDMVLAAVETTAGNPRHTEEAGLGSGGFWLVPRVVGLAKPLWDVMEEVR